MAYFFVLGLTYFCANVCLAAVYASKAKAHTVGQTVDMTNFPGSLGMTFELCAGIVDKDLGLQETAKAEIFEETGYDVPLDKIKRMTKFR